MFEEGLGQNKVLYNSQRGQTVTARFPAFFALEKQISGLLPAFDSTENQTVLDSSLSSHLARFIACLIGRSCFRFAGSWIDGLAIGGAESRVLMLLSASLNGLYARC